MNELIAKDSFSGTGNYTYTSTKGLMKQVEIVNLSEDVSLTYVCDGMTFTVGPRNISKETFVSFPSVQITATGPWNAVVRA